MKKGTFVLTLGAVAALAYLAGTYQVSLDASNIAVAQETKQGDMPEMSPEEMAVWQAMEKAGTPGPNHEVLNSMVGTWRAEYSFRMTPKAEMMTSNGTVKREWILNKHYVEEKVEASGVGDETFHGLGYIGYNNVEGVYEVVWMDNMSTMIMKETGTYDAAAKKMYFKGMHKDPVTGSQVSTRSEVDLSNPDRQIFDGWTTGPDGKEYKSMHGVAKKN